jgi:hypothetical protein
MSLQKTECAFLLVFTYFFVMISNIINKNKHLTFFLFIVYLAYAYFQLFVCAIFFWFITYLILFSSWLMIFISKYFIHETRRIYFLYYSTASAFGNFFFTSVLTIKKNRGNRIVFG